jgi:hypothetical protein
VRGEQHVIESQVSAESKAGDRHEMQEDTGRYREILVDTGRYWEIWGRFRYWELRESSLFLRAKSKLSGPFLFQGSDREKVGDTEGFQQLGAQGEQRVLESQVKAVWKAGGGREIQGDTGRSWEILGGTDRYW